MPSPETQRVRSIIAQINSLPFAITLTQHEIMSLTHMLKQDRQHILEVLKEGVRETELKMNVDEYLENVKEACGNYDLAFDQGYTQAKKDILTLLQETLGEGKEINSIFKE